LSAVKGWKKNLRSTWLKDNPEFKKYEPDIEKELWVLENQGLCAYIYSLSKMGIKVKHNESQLWTAVMLGITEIHA